MTFKKDEKLFWNDPDEGLCSKEVIYLDDDGEDEDAVRVIDNFGNAFSVYPQELERRVVLTEKQAMCLFELGCLCDKWQDKPDEVDYCSMVAFDLCMEVTKKYNLEFDDGFYYKVHEIFEKEVLPKLKNRY